MKAVHFRDAQAVIEHRPRWGCPRAHAASMRTTDAAKVTCPLCRDWLAKRVEGVLLEQAEQLALKPCPDCLFFRPWNSAPEPAPSCPTCRGKGSIIYVSVFKVAQDPG